MPLRGLKSSCLAAAVARCISIVIMYLENAVSYFQPMPEWLTTDITVWYTSTYSHELRARDQLASFFNGFHVRRNWFTLFCALWLAFCCLAPCLLVRIRFSIEVVSITDDVEEHVLWAAITNNILQYNSHKRFYIDTLLIHQIQQSSSSLFYVKKWWWWPSMQRRHNHNIASRHLMWCALDRWRFMG